MRRFGSVTDLPVQTDATFLGVWRKSLIHPWTQQEFTLLKNAAIQAGASYTADWMTYADHHMHAEW
jgi:hypothetical protein